MGTELRYSKGYERNDPFITVDIKIRINSEDGLRGDDYESLTSSIQAIKDTLSKYEEEEK